MAQLAMLSSQQKLQKKLVELRTRCKLSQARVARKAGFSQPYLAQVETGARPISRQALQRLESVYGAQLDFDLWLGVGQRGRRKRTRDTQKALRAVGRAVDEFVQRGRVHPHYPQPHQVRRSGDPLWPIGLHLGYQARELAVQLEAQRAGQELFWRDFNSLRFDSWSEKLLLVRIALLGGEMCGLRLQEYSDLELINGTTGQPAHTHRTFVIPCSTGTLLWAPQVAVRTVAGYRCLDNLLIYSEGGRTLSMAVEVNGKDFHNPERDEWRAREIGIPVLQLCASELQSPDLIARIVSWVREQFSTCNPQPA